MDTNSIGTLTGTAGKFNSKKEAAPGDADAFASVMGQSAPGETEAGSKKSDLTAKEETGKEKTEKAEAGKRRDSERVEKERDSRQDTPLDKQNQAKFNSFLKNVSSKDPATLSMAERQTFQLGEFANQNPKSLGGMAQMLASQGLDVNSFSPQQVMSMLSKMDVKDLGKVMTQLQSVGVKVDEESLKELKNQLNAQNQTAPGKEPSNFNVQEFAQAGTPKEAGEAARQEQRQMVMDQILSNIQVRNVANQTEMQLRLNPEYLGELKIQLFHDDEGGIKASFQTTSKLTREVLDESKDELMDQARSKGVRLGSMDVQFVEELG